MRFRARLIAIAAFAATAFVHPVSSSARAEAPAKQWNPSRTWVFVVGVLEWEKNRFPAFPKENRRDEVLVNTFRSRGVPSTQICFLKDSAATTQQINTAFRRFVALPKQGDWIFVYYTGHGFHTADHKSSKLASYDTSDTVPGITVATLPQIIEKRFRGSHAIIAIDCCCSGAIVRNVKPLHGSRISYAAFASSHFNSGSTGNWTFTENLIYAFSGEPYMDDNGDSVVTLGELGANIRQDMTFAENQMPTMLFTGRFHHDVVLATSTPSVETDIGTRAEFQDREQNWYRGFVADQSGDRLKIRYYGWDSTWDEWITRDRMRPPAPARLLPVGKRVEALSMDKKWYEARIVSVRGGLHQVEFDGWGPEWNEWLPADRLR